MARQGHLDRRRQDSRVIRPHSSRCNCDGALGMIMCPVGSIYAHIAGSKVNTGRKLCPEDRTNISEWQKAVEIRRWVYSAGSVLAG